MFGGRRPYSPILLLALALSATPAGAFERLEGWLIAEQDCDVTRSLSADKVGVVEAGRAYALVGANKAQATHYQVRLTVPRRVDGWVPVACGIHVVRAPAEAPPRPIEPTQPPQPVAPGQPLLLAVSWQPAFCERHAGKPECRSQSAERYDARHFTLHGLWPQPRGNAHCGVSPDDKRADKQRRWHDLPEPDLPAPLRQRLDEVMPGTRSHLHRHEWIKHGTCYGTSASVYYAHSLALMDELNGSAVQALFAANIGRKIGRDQIQAAFVEAFGAGAGARVRVRCTIDGARRMIGELWINLQGPIADEGNFAAAVARAPAVADGGCGDGEVDAVGLQ